jgi:hypothetical protein
MNRHGDWTSLERAVSNNTVRMKKAKLSRRRFRRDMDISWLNVIHDYGNYLEFYLLNLCKNTYYVIVYYHIIKP